MDTKEWFQKRKKLMLEEMKSISLDLNEIEDFKSSEIYGDPDDKTLQWEICIICRKR